MKKILLTLVCMMTLMSVGAQSLDTLRLGEWIPTYYPKGNEWVSSYTEFNMVGGVCYNGEIIARRYLTKIPLRIIGLAGVFDITKESEGHPLDTTLEGREPEYLQLYHPLADTLLLLKEVSWTDQQPRCKMELLYMRDGRFRYHYPNLYEVYFDEPVEVMDSFHVAATLKNDFEVFCYDESGHRYVRNARLFTKTFSAVNRQYGSQNDRFEKQLTRTRWTKPSPYDSTWVHHDSSWHYPETPWSTYYSYLLVFPIFDTTGVTFDDDTLGMAGVVDQYTYLTPNPANDRTVLYSSFRIREVEIHDEQGRKVEGRKVDDTMVYLDVSGYPQGLYLVTITTVAGRTTRKLVVNR